MVKTRMAPSPTGEYHIGHIRTALYNYAFAKKNKGKFVIRIEDTDRERFVEGASDRILNVLKDYGFLWDEGPYFQSQRLDIYKKFALSLIKNENAYYCFCSEERLTKLREDQRSSGVSSTKYDKKCLFLPKDEVKNNLNKGLKYVIRLNVKPNEIVKWKDEVFGEVEVNSNDLDDQVLLKSDGFPTYHLAVVVDDHLMEITHVIRGNDWIPSTPKHVLLYKHFGWKLPTYIHLPNLKEAGENKKLSKRFGAVFASEFLQQGYLPEAVTNFLMFLGWNPGTDKEIYDIKEFINDFSVEKIHKTDLVVFDRDKLSWFNGYYIRNMLTRDLLKVLKEWSKKYDVDSKVGELGEAYMLKVLELVKGRLKTLGEFTLLTRYFFEKPTVLADSLKKYAIGEENEILENYVRLFELIKVWEKTELENKSHEVLEKFGYKPKQAFMTLRIAVSGIEITPPLFDTLEVLGKDEVLQRLNTALKLLER